MLHWPDGVAQDEFLLLERDWNEAPESMFLLRQINLQCDADIGDLFCGHLDLNAIRPASN